MEQESKNNQHAPVIGISIGDVNGIGPEVIIKSLNNSKSTKYFTPVIYGSGKVISFYRKRINADHFNFNQITDLQNIYPRKVNVFNCWEEQIELTPGESNEVGGKCSFLALEKATEHLLEGKIDALVTAPINKHNIQRDGFNFPGHTEYLTEKAGSADSLMFLVTEGLRVGVATGHIPLKDVSAKLTKETLERKLNIMINTLKKDYGIGKPKVAILGLNPHAGEDGLLGSEENEVIKPVIEEFKNNGNLVMGPYPSDGFFGVGQHNKYDGVLAMYHDQGLLPFKTLAFADGVNYTAGLPFVRTSPDHGTAYAIAGKNQADETSMRAAIYAALDITNQRRQSS